MLEIFEILGSFCCAKHYQVTFDFHIQLDVSHKKIFPPFSWFREISEMLPKFRQKQVSWVCRNQTFFTFIYVWMKTKVIRLGDIFKFHWSPIASEILLDDVQLWRSYLKFHNKFSKGLKKSSKYLTVKKLTIETLEKGVKYVQS